MYFIKYYLYFYSSSVNIIEERDETEVDTNFQTSTP